MAWKQHPTTQRYLKYLRDYRHQIADSIAGHVAVGATVTPQLLEKASIRCEIMLDLENLTCDLLNSFYPDEGNKDDVV